MFNLFKKNQPGEVKKENPAPVQPKLAREEIYIMPEKFYAAPKTGLSRRTKIIIASVAAVAVVGGLAVFFSVDWQARSNQNQMAEVPANANTPANADQPANTNEINSNSNANVNANANQPASPSLGGPANANAPDLNVGGPAEEPPPAVTPDTTPAEQVVDAKDTDGDGLTDLEEELYQTDVNKPDTDADGYLDGQEVKGGYSPIAANAKLEGSKLVKSYVSDAYKYKILYPALWEAKAIDQNGSQMMFQPGSSKEFMEVIVIEDSTPLANWYKQYVSSAAAPEPIVGSLNGWQAVISSDSLTYYLTARGLGKIYIVNYNTAGLSEISFRTTFQMMVNSFTAVAEVKK